jgi:hypothetical protein
MNTNKHTAIHTYTLMSTQRSDAADKTNKAEGAGLFPRRPNRMEREKEKEEKKDEMEGGSLGRRSPIG